jgi:hypothetical protein
LEYAQLDGRPTIKPASKFTLAILDANGNYVQSELYSDADGFFCIMTPDIEGKYTLYATSLLYSFYASLAVPHHC